MASPLAEQPVVVAGKKKKPNSVVKFVVYSTHMKSLKPTAVTQVKNKLNIKKKLK